MSFEKIQEFMAITGSNQLESMNFLHDANDDLDYALNTYFENPEKFSTQKNIPITLETEHDEEINYYKIDELTTKNSSETKKNLEENYSLINGEIFEYLQEKTNLDYSENVMKCQTKENLYLLWKKLDFTKGNQNYAFYPSTIFIFQHQRNICLFGYYEGKETFSVSNQFIEPCLLNVKNLEKFDFELMKVNFVGDELIWKFTSSIRLMFSYNNNIYSFNSIRLDNKEAFKVFQYYNGNWYLMCFKEEKSEILEAEDVIGVVQVDSKIFVFFTTPKDIEKLELQIFDLQNLEIQHPSMEFIVEIPEIRNGSTFCYYDTHIYMFGGDGYPDFSNDIFQFSLEDLTWKIVEIKNQIKPKPRGFHSSFVYNDSMFIFGGKKKAKYEFQEHELLNDLYEFDFKTSTWKYITINGFQINGRYESQLYIENDVLYVLGGKCNSSNLGEIYSVKLSNENPISSFLINEKLHRDLEIVLKDGVLKFHKFILFRFHIFRVKQRFEEISKKTFLKITHFIYGNEIEFENIEELIDIVKCSYILEMVELEKYCCLKSIGFVKKWEIKKLNYFPELKNVQLLLLLNSENDKLDEQFNQFSTEFLESNIFEFKNSISCSFREHIQNLHKKKINFDLEIISLENQKFYAHKSLLLYYSKLFENEHQIHKKFEGKILKILINEIYQQENEVNIDIIDILKFLLLLKKLDIQHFKGKFIGQLKSQISITNLNLVLKMNEELLIQDINEQCQRVFSEYSNSFPFANLRLKNYELQKKIYSIQLQIQIINQTQIELKSLLNE
eukprot:gene2565-3527_t